MAWQDAYTQPLLAQRASAGWNTGHLLLVGVTCSSSLGMLTLKYSQARGNVVALAIGYLLEGGAFAVYPYCLRYTTMRCVTAVWASSSIVTSFVGGAAVYGEVPSASATFGGVLIVVGMFLTALT